MFTTIAHIQLLVNSYDETIKFYTEKLGFVLVDDQPMPMMGENMRWVVIAPQKDNQTMISVALATKEPTLSLVGKQGGGYPFLTLFTADIDTVFKSCTDNGVKIAKEISQTPWGRDMVIEDLYGNQIYIVEVPKVEIFALVTKTFNLNINTVWNGLTNPSIVKQYFNDTNLVTDLEIGSKIRFNGIYEGKEYSDGGTILELEAPNKLVYDYFSSWSSKEDKPENYQLVTYELVALNENKTKVTITQESDNQKAKTDSEKNWTQTLNEMEKVLTLKK
jgi:uncharacterized protein YndB with AHSA1/START domain/predicted enzyme related to lactoylglutathione lyase